MTFFHTSDVESIHKMKFLMDYEVERYIHKNNIMLQRILDACKASGIEGFETSHR